MNGAILSAENGVEEAILTLLKKGLHKQSFDLLLIPAKVPAGDSYAYLLIQDESLVEVASPLPPIMGVQGAKAIYSMTRRGKARKTIAAIMRPCEVRAAIELSKLEQVDLDNIFFISIDCPGVLPLKDYIQNPGESTDVFKEALEQWESGSLSKPDGPLEHMRPVCKTCHRFSMPTSDLHIGILGAGKGSLFLIPVSAKGKSVLDSLDIALDEDMSSWEVKVKEVTDERERKREEAQRKLKAEIEGPDELLETFSKCINCHNCMRVCPVCYCRQCYFDSAALKLPPENYLMRAGRKGNLRFLPDTLLFHLGRMSHMIFSCVSCGTCEDACPMSIPVAQVFSLVADRTQELLDYLPGGSMEEPLPLATYKEEELEEVEKPYMEIYTK